MSNHDEVQVSEPLDVVRRLENLFFGSDGFSPARTIELIRLEARATGVEIAVSEADGWFIISADRDWLPPEEKGLRAFTHLLPLPELGVNASRSEVLLTAFARVVLTACAGETNVIADPAGQADQAKTQFAEVLSRAARTIIFLP